MMRRGLSACLLTFAGACAFGPVAALAQGPGLGGYGAMSSMAPAGIGASGPIIPYGGSLSGFMPSRMGGGGTGLSFSSRNSSMMGAARSSFRLSAIGGEMSMPSARFGQSFGGRDGMGASLSTMGLGGWDEPSDGYETRERHAAKLWLSLLPAAEPARAVVGVHGNVVDVRAPERSESSRLGQCAGFAGAERAVCADWWRR